ncbi:hypothetical protein CAC42_5450 [Sphaceloma murrayae]|uniref:Uncharacterized protein n=1 Tax=Sphaceloma murrayae TaxID=2082308 RepID=A0A2K1QV21_9PEZI|nr:hypothetical protein CAC42_5450 [Sphaceloma murrayae]
MSTSPLSPFSQIFGHHEEYARRLVESTPPHQISDQSLRQYHIHSQLESLTEANEDHVLRGSRSGAATRSASSTLPFEKIRLPLDNAAIFPAPVLGEIDPNNQRVRSVAGNTDSPTASLKKKKAEQILKQHGSPPGIRVTAGGRIVPSEQSPLCSPRYGYSAVQKNGGLIKFAPGYPPPPKSFSSYAKSLPNGWVLQDPSGKLVQVVDGRFLMIQESNGIPQLYITAPNVTNMAWSQFHEANAKPASDRPPKSDTGSKPDTMKDPTIPSASGQIAALEKHYQKLEAERRSLDKTEVLKRNELTGNAYTQLVQKRRELVERQDKIRRSIKALKETQNDAGQVESADTTDPRTDTQLPQLAIQPPFLMQGQFPMDSNMSGIRMPLMLPAGPGELPVLVPQPYYPGALPQFFPMGSYLPAVSSSATSSMAAPGTAPMAMYPEIHQPLTSAPTNYGSIGSSENDKDASHSLRPAVTTQRSALNPMSPIYEPGGSKTNTPEKKRPSTRDLALDNSIIMATGASKSTEGSGSHDSRSTHNSSEASYATADFFPNNPREHSLRKDAYPLPRKQPKPVAHSSITTHLSNSEEAIAQPEMERHNPNWNPTIPDQVFQRTASASMSTREKTGDNRHASPANAGVASDNIQAEGFRAGLVRAPIGVDKSKEWLDGYCKGLLQSAQPSSDPSSESNQSRLVIRLPSGKSTTSPAPANVTITAPSPQLGTGQAAPQKVDLSSLKQLVSSPANENAILSPDPDGPSVDAIQGKTLGAWSKENSSRGTDEGHARGQRSSSVDKRISSSGMVHFDSAAKVAVSDFAQTRVEPEDLTGGHRTFSAQTQPARDLSSSYFQRAYGAHRVLSSPMDWRSGTTVAQVAGLAGGYFAQFDGTSSKPAPKSGIGQDNHSSLTTATKFKEGSMPQDGPCSPDKTSATSSPKKAVSPAKAKFAAIAGKAGIKVRTDRPVSKESNDLEPMSPQERRRWRNVWKKRNTGIE